MAPVESDVDNDRSIGVLELPVVGFVYFLAISTCSLMAGLYFSWSFTAASLCVAASLPLACVVAWRRWKRSLPVVPQAEVDTTFVAFALLVSIVGGALAASINRPDIDDSIYVSKAVYYTEHPGAPLDKDIHSIAGVPASPTSVVFQHYETTHAALAHLLHLHVLDLYHIVFPAIAGFLTCLATLLVVSLFERRGWVRLTSLVLFMLLILALGETHRTFGNLSFARAFQGKFVFLAVGVPIWTYFSLRFMAVRQVRDWAVLVAAGIGMVGASTTAMVFVPLLSGLLLLSYLFDRRSLAGVECALLAMKYLSSTIPVILLAFRFRSEAAAVVSVGAKVNSGFPSDFAGQLRFLVNSDYPLTPIVFIGALVAVLVASEHRRFFGCWVLAGCAFLLNPLVSGPVMTYVTTENIYWRLFYILPFPLIVPIAVAAVARSSTAFRVGGAVLICAIAWLAFRGPTSVLRSGNATTIGWPGYKIHEPELSVVRQITARLPSGSMFAPLEISSNLLICTSKFPQFHLREDYLRLELDSIGMSKDYANRSRLNHYLYKSEWNLEGTRLLEGAILSESPPDYFVLRHDSKSGNAVRSILTKLGYQRLLSIGGRYEIYSRRGQRALPQ